MLKWIQPAIAVAVVLLALGAAWHALLFKRDSRSAFGWVAVCLFFPAIGPLVYFMFGINRIHTRARRLGLRATLAPAALTAVHPPAEHGAEIPPEMSALVRISDAVSGRPLVGGNAIDFYRNGEEAYAPMLVAIDGAQHSVRLASYIFETDATGRRFVDALGRAVNRGVGCRVIVDGAGELYSRPRATRLLSRRGVPTARFLPPRLFPPQLHVNLRTHRKILTVDGAIGFTGGMNIGDRHMAADEDNPDRVIDTHCRLRGPVVAQMEEVFDEDWRFLTGDAEGLPTPGFTAPPAGAVACRTIVDGPNEDFDKLGAILLGAISAADKRVLVMTPYFVPSQEMISAFASAALRGVDVRVVLPGMNNLPAVQWASRHLMWELLLRGVRIYEQPPPFVHTKLFVVDDHYVQIGSANLDPRSLRLNFELSVEVYDRRFAERVSAHILEAIARSVEIRYEDHRTRSLGVRTRDAIAWLFSPYL